MRLFVAAGFGTAFFLIAADVDGLRGIGRDEPELLVRGRLDARARRGRAELGAEARDVGLELRRVLRDVVALEVQAQDRDVDRDHAGEEHGEERDPDDAARDEPRLRAATAP